MTTGNPNAPQPQFRRVTIHHDPNVGAHHYVGPDRARQEAFATAVVNAFDAAAVNGRTGAVSLAIPSAPVRVIAPNQKGPHV